MKNLNESTNLIEEERAVLEAEIIALQAENRSLKSNIAELTAKVDWFMKQLRLSRQHRFGSSSEKSDYDGIQLSLFGETAADSEKKPESETVTVEKHIRRKKTSLKERLPEDLPVLEEIVYELPEDERLCLECNEIMKPMGREVREELVVVPATVGIRKHITVTYSCRPCSEVGEYTPFKKAKAPEPVIKGSCISPEAVSHTMCQKFVMGLPLYRQEQEWNRNGIPISRQTLSNCLIKSAIDWLVPIYNRLIPILIARDMLHADETTLQVLHEPGKPPQSKSYMWLYRTGGDAENHILIYEYKPNRKAEHPETFLKGFKGYLHADGYDGYHSLPETIKVVGCWVHARRKFVEGLKMLPEKDRKGTNCYKGKQFIDKLFSLERSFAELSADERFKKRLEESKPIIDEFFKWLETTNFMPKTAFGAAAGYALSQKQYLERYLLDGRLEISNNRAERSMKTFAVDRKNFLFCNTVNGANAAAVVFSLIETAKANGLLPFQYLTYVFKNAPNIDVNNPDVLKTLLPFRENLPDYIYSPISKTAIRKRKFAWDYE
jgi:transposase